ncbi:MAG: metalloenzyme domain-containing protein [Planctomycetota bacterium]|nr:MAG: metalloenzyme domain-containing protein [Planctomycetota bacterium]REJ95437.1 MAG: metalloenzyme domain-containing protein [Planctomycetota bacterium]REK24176.1 MAG: metalloenzyme domain-containing protein [Planctomycetota bacterium]REK28837.1 MAG: metalloenzyme domain-containing protein [Planctomycetota bacterium]
MTQRPAKTCVAPSDLLMMTFDALRFDVADAALREGRTPFLKSLLPDGWEARHSPGSFTYAAHAALFAGFWPTPQAPGHDSRPFALRFPGSRTIGATTVRLEGDNIVQGLSQQGYHTICIGGVGFFNKATPLGSVFPAMFDESDWQPEFGVSEAHSARAQVQAACRRIGACPSGQPLFLFVNLSATHPPTHGYLPGSQGDSVASQVAALAYVDRQLPTLFAALRNRARGGTAYLMSDHGTLFGEQGLTGHRVGHPAVWTVPYAEYHWEPGQ